MAMYHRGKIGGSLRNDNQVKINAKVGNLEISPSGNIYIQYYYKRPITKHWAPYGYLRNISMNKGTASSFS